MNPARDKIRPRISPDAPMAILFLSDSGIDGSEDRRQEDRWVDRQTGVETWGETDSYIPQSVTRGLLRLACSTTQEIFSPDLHQFKTKRSINISQLDQKDQSGPGAAGHECLAAVTLTWVCTPGESGSGRTSHHQPAHQWRSHQCWPPVHLSSSSLRSVWGRSRRHCTPTWKDVCQQGAFQSGAWRRVRLETEFISFSFCSDRQWVFVCVIYLHTHLYEPWSEFISDQFDLF